MPGILRISGKVSDLCAFVFLKDDSKYGGTGYPPKGVSIANGDYINLEIDVDSGKIANWKFDEETYIEENNLKEES